MWFSEGGGFRNGGHRVLILNLKSFIDQFRRIYSLEWGINCAGRGLSSELLKSGKAIWEEKEQLETKPIKRRM